MITIDENSHFILTIMKTNDRALELEDLCDLSGLDEDSVSTALIRLRELGFVAAIDLDPFDS